jgi:hypothetical protein
MIRRRAAAAGIATKLGNHSFRATGITTYLKNDGTLEKAATMANHPDRMQLQQVLMNLPRSRSYPPAARQRGSAPSPRRARRSSMIASATRSLLMRLSELLSDII